ncbi:MAG: GNAT family N-acetyltransferase [Candidatus Rokuibacteriota bacterium]
MAQPEGPVDIRIAEAATPEVVEAFGRLLPQLSSSAAPLTREALTEIIASPHNTVLLARDTDAAGRIIGTLTLVIFRSPTAVRAWIEDVVVDGTARGRGAGEALTLAAVNLARRRGAKTVDLTSHRSRQAAHRLYEKCGFHVRDTSVYRFGPKPEA